MNSGHLDISGYLVSVEHLEKMLREQGYHLIPSENMRMLTISGYIERFHENISKTATYTEAWERTENEFFTTFSVKRFDSYHSFRTSSKVQKHIKK